MSEAKWKLPVELIPDERSEVGMRIDFSTKDSDEHPVYSLGRWMINLL